MGFGKYDVFFARKDNEGNWLEPMNIGSPINNEGDQHGFVVSTDGKTVYFGSNLIKEGGKGGYDGVGKDTFLESINSLSVRGLLVSFGQSSGMIEKLNMHQTFNPKSLFYTRPNLMNYILNRKELTECSNKLFEKMRSGKVKTNIFKKIHLEEAQKAHEILQSRQSFGSIILKP